MSQGYNYTHLSAGDLLREERAREGSEFGQLIDNYIKEGKIVPVEITINLLKNVCTKCRLYILFVSAQRANPDQVTRGRTELSLVGTKP